MAGRKPLPTHLKLVKGTARPHRLNKDEPQPTVAVPEPPAHLDERARAKFAAMAELLARHGVMTELDAGALSRYVVVWCRWIDAEAEIKRRGPVVKTEGGFRRSQPSIPTEASHLFRGKPAGHSDGSRPGRWRGLRALAFGSGGGRLVKLGGLPGMQFAQ